MQQHGARPCWIGYLGVDDVDASVAAIEGAGGKLLMPARDIEMAGRIAMVADPNGAPFYVMTPMPPPGGGESTAFSPTLVGRCAWNELMGSRPAGGARFLHRPVRLVAAGADGYGRDGHLPVRRP